MRDAPVAVILIGALFAPLVGCKDAKIKMDDVNGFNANRATNAIFGSAVDTGDFDGDGQDDDSIALLSIVVSDQPDLCARIEAGETIDDVADVISADVFVSVLQVDSTADPFVSGSTFVGDGQDLYVDVGFLVKEGGVIVAQAYGDGRGTAEIYGTGDSFNGGAIGVLVSDVTDPANPATISASIEAKLHAIPRCDALFP